MKRDPYYHLYVGSKRHPRPRRMVGMFFAALAELIVFLFVLCAVLGSGVFLWAARP